MNDNVETMLNSEIVRQFNELKNEDITSEHYDLVLNRALKLYKLKIDDNQKETDLKREEIDFEKNRMKAIAELNEREEDLKLKEKNFEQDGYYKQCEINLKREELKNNKIDRYYRIGYDVGSKVLDLMFVGMLVYDGFIFEEKGTFSSLTFRTLFTNFLKVRK